MGNSCIVDLFCYTCQTNNHLVLWEYCIHSSDLNKFAGYIEKSHKLCCGGGCVGGASGNDCASGGASQYWQQLKYLQDHLEQRTVPDSSGFHKFFLCSKCVALVPFEMPAYVSKNKVSQIQDLDASW